MTSSSSTSLLADRLGHRVVRRWTSSAIGECHSPARGGRGADHFGGGLYKVLM
jgi:hypothetical protein